MSADLRDPEADGAGHQGGRPHTSTHPAGRDWPRGRVGRVGRESESGFRTEGRIGLVSVSISIALAISRDVSCIASQVDRIQSRFNDLGKGLPGYQVSPVPLVGVKTV